MGIRFESLDAIIFDLDDTLVDEGYWIEKRWEKTIEFVENSMGIGGFSESFWRIYRERGRKYKKHVNKALERCGQNEQQVEEIVTFFLGQTTFEEPLSGVFEFLEEAEVVSQEPGEGPHFLVCRRSRTQDLRQLRLD